jgi:hypothetical protein
VGLKDNNSNASSVSPDSRFITPTSAILTSKYDDEARAGSTGDEACTWQAQINQVNKTSIQAVCYTMQQHTHSKSHLRSFLLITIIESFAADTACATGTTGDIPFLFCDPRNLSIDRLHWISAVNSLNGHILDHLRFF